jgi:hypothetical protein
MVATCLGWSGPFGELISRGLIVSVKRYLQNAVDYVSYRLVRAFFLQPVVLVCLLAASGQAASDLAYDDNRSADRLNHKPFVILKGMDPLRDDDDPPMLRVQADDPIQDESPFGKEETPVKKKETIEPITRKLPIWGEKVRAMGYELPLPFGAGINLVYMDQGIDIRNLKIGFGDPSQKVEWVTFSNASAKDKAATARLDMWLLPFANIYGILGYIDGEAELDVNLPGFTIGPFPIPPKTISFDIDYSGTTVGGGITLAGGYKNFFGSLDANYSYSEIDVVDGDIETLTISPRVGVLVDPAVVKGSFAFWIGAMYMDYKQTVTDSVNLNELDPNLPALELEFEIDIENEEPWNFLMGGQWEITKRWQMLVEGGVGNRQQIIFGTMFRF